MALPVDDTQTEAPAAPFTWGAGGGRMTPEQIAAQRKVAAALAANGADYSPIRSVWQGLARAAQGLNAGLAERRANDAASENASENAKMIASLLSGGGGQAAASPAASPSSPAASASIPAAAPAVDTTGKIYSNDEPSPLDPPSGQNRDDMIRTVYGEAGNEPTQGQLAVANVIRTRAVDGGYGGDTPSGVVRAPNQFEPWNGGVARDRMLALSPDDPKYAAIGKVVDAAYGTGGRAPEDPTEGMTHFYSPTGQTALGRKAPAWAGGESVTIGGHVFNSPDDAGGKPVQVADASGGVPAAVAKVAAAQGGDPAALPAAAAPAEGYAIPGQPAPAVTPVKSGLGAVNPNVMRALTSPYADDATKKIAGLLLTQQMTPKEVHAQETDANGNIWDVNRLTGQRTVALKKETASEAPYRDADGNLVQRDNTGKVSVLSAADKAPGSVKEFEYGQTHPEFTRQQLEKTKAGAAQLNNQNNIDMNSGQTYDKQIAEGLGKAHAALSNGVEDAQARARDLAAMQGAIDAIQKAGGTTGGMGQAQVLEIKKTINAGAAALGLEPPVDEKGISDKEFLTKFNRQIAGAQAKNAVGSRVTNFEMSNYLKANPGLEMSVTGNQRLIGIQSQIEQRNIAVGNAIRDATAAAIGDGKKINPVAVQKIIKDYDDAHHVQDPVTGQDLTQSYTLPEFQSQGTNAELAAGHEKNLGKIRVWHPETGVAP